MGKVTESEAATLAAAGDNARAKGWSWQDIAGRLGVTKQAVHQKHGPRGRSREGR
jgi:hypothetical protein